MVLPYYWRTKPCPAEHSFHSPLGFLSYGDFSLCPSSVSQAERVAAEGEESPEDGRTLMDTSDGEADPAGAGRLVPVFVVPEVLRFVVGGSPADSRRVLTLYNPYEYPFAYKVLCTAPEFYYLTEPEGVVQKKCVKDIPIRARPTLQLGMQHRIRVEIRHLGCDELLGARTLQISPLDKVCAAALAAEQQEGGTFRRLQRGSSASLTPDSSVRIDNRLVAVQPDYSSVVWLTLAACVVALFLPLLGEQDSLVPPMFHLSLAQKLVAAFLLGVCSVLILAPHNPHR